MNHAGVPDTLGCLASVSFTDLLSSLKVDPSQANVPEAHSSENWRMKPVLLYPGRAKYNKFLIISLPFSLIQWTQLTARLFLDKEPPKERLQQPQRRRIF